MADDFIRDLLFRVRARYPSMTRSEFKALEVELRQVWGGARPYIARKPAEKKAWGLGTDLAGGVSLAEAFAQAHVGRRWGYRLLQRKLG